MEWERSVVKVVVADKCPKRPGIENKRRRRKNWYDVIGTFTKPANWLHHSHACLHHHNSQPPLPPRVLILHPSIHHSDIHLHAGTTLRTVVYILGSLYVLALTD
jgi:hypothetical protein